MVRSVAADKDVRICSENRYANIRQEGPRAAFAAPEFPEAGARAARGAAPSSRGGRVGAAPSSLLGRAGSAPAASQPGLLLTFL